MIKLSKNIKKYALFILVCFLPLFVSAYTWTYNIGTMSPGEVETDPNAWWDVFDCTTNKTGPFTVEVVSTPNYYWKSYNRSVKISVDDYVPTAINGITTTCTYYDVEQGDPDLDSGRITYEHVVVYTYNIAAGGTPTTTTNDKTYYLYKGQTIDLVDKLGISSIESFTYVSGSQHNTLGYSGCAAGNGACSITFDKGVALQNRDHVFRIKYVNVAGKTYETTINVYEQSNVRTDYLGYLDPGDHTYSIFDENTSNFTCSKVSPGPYEVDEDIDGESGRIKITSTNYSISSYSDLKAQCTYNKSGVLHTITYEFGLTASNAVEKNKEYTANGGETFNIWSDLNMKQIISSTVEFTSNGTTTGCYPGNTKCSVKMDQYVEDGKSTSAVIIYYDKSNVLTQSTVTINEQQLSIENDLGTIGVNNTVNGTIPASDVTCSTTSTGPFTHKLTKSGTGYVLAVTNNNVTVNAYNNLMITCTGTPNGVGDKIYRYNFKFGLSNQTTPIKSARSFELFQDESIDFSVLYPIKKMYKNIEYTTGSSSGVMSITGCTKDNNNCKVSLVGPNIQQNRQHKMVVSYVNGDDVLYEVTVNIIEKDRNLTTKAYPGLLGFCDFDEQWEYATWANSSGKNYSFYEASVRGAKLPKCSANATSGVPLVFKGWTKGYNAGDALTTKESCGTDLLQPGQATSYGQTYAPCYEMSPHVRLSVNAGTLKNPGSFVFNSADMTFMATGSSYNQEVALPDVQYTGFHSSSSLQVWRNSTTGDTKRPGEKVKLDGSIWVAVSSRTVTQVDLYKTIGLDEVKLFTVEGMTYCSASNSYVSASYRGGDCEVKGLVVTPFDVYGDVTITLNDGSTRVYKFNVEDRSTINDDDNGIFNVDTDDNIEIGKNDDSTLNDFNTDQCESFLISRSGDNKDKYPAYKKYHFADSISNGEAMNTGIYSVYQLCPTDYSTYVGLCLDPGRRGPNEYGTGTHSKTFMFKDEEIKVSGNEYTKTDDLDRESNFGKLVMYIVKNLGISDFNTNTDDAMKRRAAAHVAVRSMAIVDQFSESPDPSDEVYSTHYYPYQGVANVIKSAMADGNVSETEARTAVYSGSTCLKNGDHGTSFGCGFKNWQNDVDSLVVQILSKYDNSNTDGPTDGFQRTIDDTVLDSEGNKYTINYTGTITAPTGATAKMSICRNAAKYGVECKINANNDVNGDGIKDGWKSVTNADGRNTYTYDVSIIVSDASLVKPPTTVDEEKDLSFQIEYSGGHDLVNAFIASPANGSDNVQRMLIISTSNPKVYIYFSVVPNSCDLPILDPKNCPNTVVDAAGNVIENKCKDNIDNKVFNAGLFKAAGCCKYVLDESSYLFKRVCSAECTSSTLTSACEYTLLGKGNADFYTINEGSKYVGNNATPENAIGTCVVNVNDLYKNDGGASLKVVDPSETVFTKFDDGNNLINVDAYNDNRYCQVTCEEDWEFSMDSFGNFIGEEAVAAGTYFQIVSNDMFMSAKRTCYTTFINYDRFMQNIVELSNQLVDAYNDYSEWSHVWTDIDQQETDGWSKSYSSDALNYHKDSTGVVCVEYFDECPDNTIGGSLLTASGYDKYDYYYNGTTLATSCKSINYSTIGDVTKSTCETPADEGGKAYRDADPTLTNSAINSDATMCTFVRTYCDDKHSEHNQHEYWNYNQTSCLYRDYETRDTEDKVWGYVDRTNYTPDKWVDKVGGSCPTGYSQSTIYEDQCFSSNPPCATGYTKSGTKCYSNTSCTDTTYSTYTGSTTKCRKKVCPANTTEIDGVCYSNSCPVISGVTGTADSSYPKECYVVKSTGTHTKDVTSTPIYKYTPLRCKTWGKVYDYSLKTEDDIEVKNKDGKDIYYDTEEYDEQDLADNTVGGAKDTTQNKPVDKENVKENYSKTFYYDCTITPATVSLGAVGSSTCSETGDYNFSSADNIFCKSGNYATATGATDRFCDAGGGASYTDKNNNATQKAYDSYSYYDYKAAFEFMTKTAKDDAKDVLDGHRSTMTSLQSRIYGHAQDIFDCQNFQLHNRTDDSYVNRKNNATKDDTIMGMLRSYVKINTDFDPTAAYKYDEEFFMERLDKDNVLIRFDEKNDGWFASNSGQSGNGASTCVGSYDESTNCRVDASIQTSAGKVNTKLSRNYLETYYYNPDIPWCYGGCDTDDADDKAEKYKLDNYEDTTVSPDKESKKIVLCSVGVESKGTGYATGKDGAVIPFSATAATPKWLGGRCFEVTVDYKKVRYVKSSISNSSYFKNKGNWYVRGGDSKIHGDDISNAISKFNRIKPSGYKQDYRDTTEEHKRWSRLGSFNVFPISMATPRNLYQYTYTFGNIGSYYNGDLGRIMGSEKSIIQNNTRTCFYEVYEEVCLCCGYKIEIGDIVEDFIKEGEFKYDLSDIQYAGGNTHGTISFYTNSVALGDIDLGRDSTTLGDNWSKDSLFMYNGDDDLVTDKGHKLKENIEATGENIYARKPEYAYFLNPDSLKQIRSYNDANGYDLNLEKLKVYSASNIACDGSDCKEGDSETINFQHYGSKFLLGEIAGIDLNSYGTIKNTNTKVCVIHEESYSSTYDISKKIENEGCRWVDYIEKSNNYEDPTTNAAPSNQWFRLAFK